MGRKPCCGKGVVRGTWSGKEDQILSNYIKVHGEGKWRDLPRKAGLRRCGKSCRLRWLNYLKPDIKRGNISEDEEDLIIRLHKLLGNRWTLIAGRLPGRTDNEIKNYWNTTLSKRVEGNTKNPKRSSKKSIKTTRTQETRQVTHEVICPIAVRCRNNKTFSQQQWRNSTNPTEVLTEDKTILLNRSSEDHHSSSGFLMDSEIEIGELFLSVHHEKENAVDFGDNSHLVNKNENHNGAENWIAATDSWQENDEWDLEDIASFLITEDV